MILESTLLVILAFVNAAQNIGCLYTPTTTVSNFTPNSFSGNWYLVYSTIYKQDRVGCATWTLTNPNSKGLLETSFTSNAIFSWNYFDKGNSFVSSEIMSYTA